MALDPSLLAVVAVFLGFGAFWHWDEVYADPKETVSGDGYYIRRMAFAKGKPVSKPYCWRPLYPFLARYFGFRPVSYVCMAGAVYMIYLLAGGGWAGAALAIGYFGNICIGRFAFRCPDYCDALGQFLFAASLYALLHHSPWVILLAALCALTRENLGATIGLLSLFFQPWAFASALAAGLMAYYLRREDHLNVHPLVEQTAYGTLVRWARAKKDGVLHWAHTVQPLRGLPFFIPFGWSGAPSGAGWLLLGFCPLFLFAIPASGQSRMLSYGYGLCVPFAAVCGIEWLWVACLLQWFWPIDLASFDEGGGLTWGSIR
jgi:hypothetical protein